MKKQLLAASVAASIGVLGSGIASAMEFSVYGSIRAGYYTKDTDDVVRLEPTTRTFIIGGNETGSPRSGDVERVNELREALDQDRLTPAQIAALNREIESLQARIDEDVNGEAERAYTTEIGWIDTDEGDVGGASADMDTDGDGMRSTELDVDRGVGVEDVDITDEDGNVINPGAALLRTRTTVTAAAAATAAAVAAGVAAATPTTPGASELGVNNAGSRIGIRGTEDLGNGASAGFVFERGSDGAGALNRRHENVWIKGGWGQLTLGHQGNPYRDAANWDQSFWIGGNNRYGDGGSRINGLKYNNAAGPFSFSLMATADDTDSSAPGSTTRVCATNGGCDEFTEAATRDGHYAVTTPAVDDEDGIDSFVATAHFDIGVATLNAGWRSNNQDASAPGVSYDNAAISVNGKTGPITWYVAYEKNDDNVDRPRVTTIAAGGGHDAIDLPEVPATGDDPLVPAVDVGEADGGTPIPTDGGPGLTYANRLVTLSEPQDADTLGVFLHAALGEKNAIYLEWENSNVDGYDVLGLEDLDRQSTLLGYHHKFGPHTSFIVEYVQVDNDSDAIADSDTLLAFLKVDF